MEYLEECEVVHLDFVEVGANHIREHIILRGHLLLVVFIFLEKGL
jgi:hypothetical protein